MPDATTLMILASFLLAGWVKGVIGLGLPTISLALLALVTDLPSAMTLLLVPSLVTNLWQAFAGTQTRLVLARCWVFLAAALPAIWVGALALARVESSLLAALLGVLLIAYAAASLAGLRISLSARQARCAGPLFGLVNGVLTGMTGSFVVPGVIYLQALGLNREALMQAMGLLFALSTLALGLALHGHSLLARQEFAWSALALLPALGGMLLGQRLRRRIPEAVFRRLFFGALLVLGACIVARSLGAWPGGSGP